MNFLDRAAIPPEAMGIMTARTLANSHPALLSLLEPGVSVLDVGCGPGALTIEIARRVAPGHVVGMDLNPQMIESAEAASPPGEMPNLVFYHGDIRESGWHGEFDVANAARVLQWIADAPTAVQHMARAVAPGGSVVLLDYDHTRARWTGGPESWSRFYSAFLRWRREGGLDNAIAARLSALAERAGLVDLEIVPQVTTVRAGEADFFRVAGTWRMVIESRGRQMVSAGFATEDERRAALAAYTEWMKQPAVEMTTCESAVIGRRPPAATRSRSRGGAGRRRSSPREGAGR